MKRNKISGQIVLVATFVVLIALSPLAHSAGLNVSPGLIAVPDQALATMRGKYVASTTQVVYFGVQMQSNWTTPNGSMLSAGADVSINLTQATPVVSFHPTVNIVASDTPYQLTDTTGRTVTNAGVDNISGVTQSTQVAGDFNSTVNLTRINFLSDIPPEAALDGPGITDVSQSATEGGMSAYSALQGNSAVVRLEVAGQGTAEQSVRGTIVGASGRGAYQTIVVLGDHHRISNQLAMNLVIRKTSDNTVQQQGMGTAIGNLRGLSPGL